MPTGIFTVAQLSFYRVAELSYSKCHLEPHVLENVQEFLYLFCDSF